MGTLSLSRVAVRAKDADTQSFSKCSSKTEKDRPVCEAQAEEPAYEFTYISFGAGVQSTALLVMSNLGLHKCPRAHVAIFADTQCEPQWVYDHLSYMESWSAIPVVRVTLGNLASDLEQRLQGERRRASSIPGWTKGENGRAAPLWRQCTHDYKIVPIQRKVREMKGYKPRQAVKTRVACLLGISRDEITRMRPSRVKWITNVYPLIDAHMNRSDCAALLRE
jgi:3'-phosphoadenosine 5'-phosphosulfate sulfotransferase (PAPS reductase)/FAD synthetase